VGGRLVDATSLLCDGSRIELGPGVKLQMHCTHPLSLTARLDFLSRHRTQPAADAVLLLADSCVLGPKPQSHVVCREWTREVILFRHEERLFCHATGRFEIDGVTYKNRGPLQANSRVSGEGFSFSLEPLAR
jgi:ligand-binding SRPBCC domain-containing protein